MRLSRLLIEKYGNIDQADLAFDPSPGCINLLLAPNGAGKSVLRQAFHDLLFGIPLQSPMKFQFGYPGMNLQARARSAAGEEFSFGFKRGPGRTFPDGEAAGSRWLAELLTAVNPRQVELLFALDTARLRKGGHELASVGEGTLGNALLAGTGELSPARKLRRTLHERRLAIWERSKSSRPLNAAISDLAKAAKRRRDETLNPRELAELEKAIEAAEQRRADAARAGAAAQATLSRLTRLTRAAGLREPLASLQAAEAWLAEHRDAPVLPANAGADLAKARQELEVSAGLLAQAQAGLQASEAQQAAIVRDAAAEAVDADLSALSALMGDAAQKRQDIPLREAERDAAYAAVADALREIGLAASPETADALIPALPLAERAREQIRALTKAEADARAAHQAADKARTDLAAAQQDQTAAAPVPDELEPLVADIKRDRSNPALHAAELARAVAQAEAAERACLGRIPGWSGGMDALLALPAPAEATLDRLDERVQQARRAAQDALAERDRLAKQRTGWAEALAALRAQKLPDEAAIAAARASRDLGWRLIHQRAFGAGPDTVGEAAYTQGEPLPLVFERHLRAADALADARMTELARLEQAAALRRQLQDSEPAWDRATAALANAQAALDAAVAAWDSAASPLGAATLREAKAVLDARRAALDARQATDAARAELDAVTTLHGAWAARLAALLALPGDLPSLLPVAEARLKAAADAKAAAAAQARARARAETALRTADAALAAAQHDLSALRGQWATTLQELGRPAGESPGVTDTVLTRLTNLGRDHQKARELQTRIDAMHADLATFERRVASLASALGLPGEDPFTTATALVARRDAARRLASAAEQAAKALDSERTRLRDAEQRHAAADIALKGVLVLCGAADPDSAEARINAARERQRQEAARDAALSRLREIAGATPPADLQAELDAMPPERFEAERLSATQALDDARQAGDAALEELIGLRRRYDDEAGSTSATDAAQAEAATVAQAGRLLDDYLVLRVASAMLGRALERVEQDAGPTGAQRIARAFEAVTGGAWTIETTESDTGVTELVAVDGTGAKRSIDQLSEGTRDQLYLALRLVAIETHVASAPALPFIADDVLQTFDDTRARSAMQALIGLSQHVQVIVLSHHDHLLHVADGLPVHVQRL